MLFHGGLIPTYITVKELGLLNSIWAFVLPNAVPIFSVVLLLNFFREVPKELEEAAFMDGAGYWKTLWRIYVPISKPALATLALFSMVEHWNSWFDGLIYMGSPANYPLQSYLQTIVIQQNLLNLTREELAGLEEVIRPDAESFPDFPWIPADYCWPIPFLQKYFVKGIVLGSVKG